MARAPIDLNLSDGRCYRHVVVGPGVRGNWRFWERCSVGPCGPVAWLWNHFFLFVYLFAYFIEFIAFIAFIYLLFDCLMGEMEEFCFRLGGFPERKIERGIRKVILERMRLSFL